MNKYVKYLLAVISVALITIISVTAYSSNNEKATTTKSNATFVAKIKEAIKPKENLIAKDFGKEEQIKVNEENAKDFVSKVDTDTNYIEIPSINTIQQINKVDIGDKEEENQKLLQGAISYQKYGKPGSGNYVVFGHHGYYEDTYFTNLVGKLKVNDKVYIYTLENGEKVKYTYKININYTTNKDDVESVYYDSEKPILTIGTCEKAYKTDKRLIWQGELIEREVVNEK